jgi:uncharacterized damage-inducible protein DinB
MVKTREWSHMEERNRMPYEVLKKAVLRHLEETRLLIDQLTDQVVLSEPVPTGRSVGELFLHMIRSMEYYLRGLVLDRWEPLPYNLGTYRTAADIKGLYENVAEKVGMYLEKLQPDILERVEGRFNRTATRAEMLLEMLEHSVQHRGQILVYFRLLGIEPAKIPYIV